MQDQVIQTYRVKMDDKNLGLKPEVLIGMYAFIEAKARQLAPEHIRNELIISQDNKMKSQFLIQVSNRMAPHFISAIQQQADMQQGIGLKSYFYKLQEQIMSQMFAGVKDVIS
jgi:hypothetical protein